MINDDKAFTISLMISSMPAALLTFKLAVASWTSASLILKINSLNILFVQLFIQAQIKENTKAPRHWPLWGEFTGNGWIPHTKGQ